jgi:NADH:ubiquinone oxidoreductase subunit H
MEACWQLYALYYGCALVDVFLRCLGPLIFVSLVVLIVMVRITTPRMRVESMARLGWQPLLWLLLLTFGFYFLGWFWA